MKDREKVTLYGIVAEFEQLEQRIDESPTGEDDELFLELLGKLESKTDGVVGYIQMREDQLDTISKRIKELKGMKATVQNRLDNFKRYLTYCLNRLDGKYSEGELHTIKIRKGPNKVKVLDENKIDSKYWLEKTELSLDKQSLLTDLKSGEIIDGVKLEEGGDFIKVGTK